MVYFALAVRHEVAHVRVREDYLRESASPYSLPALIDALDEVTDQLSHAEREAFHGIPPDMGIWAAAFTDLALATQT